MATAAIATTRSASLVRRFVELIPGLLLLAVVGYGGKFIEQSIAAYTKPTTSRFPTLNMFCGRSSSA